MDYFETYEPVVSWSTVRLDLTLTLLDGWHKKEVDYTNVFSQEDLEEQFFSWTPVVLLLKNGKDKVMNPI